MLSDFHRSCFRTPSKMAEVRDNFGVRCILTSYPRSQITYGEPWVDVCDEFAKFVRSLTDIRALDYTHRTGTMLSAGAIRQNFKGHKSRPIRREIGAACLRT